MNKILTLILSGFLTACGASAVVHAKPSAPVKIEYSVPEMLQTGVEVNTVIRFVAQSDLQRLVVSATPYSGLVLVSGGDSVEFSDMGRGDFREIEVNIRLTDEEVGYLSVFAKTLDAWGRTRSNSIAIRYGTAGEATAKKLRSKGLVDNPKGEKLILMPGESR